MLLHSNHQGDRGSMDYSIKRAADHRYIVRCIILFFLYLLSQLVFLWSPMLNPDEADVFAGGKAIARGFLLYRDYLTQHMPFSYYVSALFDAAGFRSVYAQRFMFFVLFAGLWLLIYVKYRKYVNPKALAFFPLVFNCITAAYEFGPSILSEHLAGIGFVVLFLEYLTFRRVNDLRVSDCLMISLGIVLSFGTIFIAILGIFVVASGFLIKEIRDVIQASKKKILHRFLHGLKLLGIIAAPWVIYLLVVLSDHSLPEVINSAYVMNRTIYPNYIGGFGMGPLWSVSVSINNAFEILTDLKAGGPQLIVIVCFLGYIAMCYKKGKMLDAFVSFALIVMCGGPRGIFNFHGTHCVAVLSFMMTIFILEVASVCKEKDRKNIPVAVICAVCALIFASPYLTCFEYLSEEYKIEPDSESAVLAELTSEEEGILMCTSDYTLFELSDRVPVYGATASPWMYEAQSGRIMAELENNPPRVCVMDDSYDVIGYKVSEYGAQMLEYVRTNYTNLVIDGVPSHVYVRNDAVDFVPERYR